MDINIAKFLIEFEVLKFQIKTILAKRTGDWDFGSNNLTTTGDGTFDELTITKPSQNWLFGAGTVLTHPLFLQGQTSGQATFLQLRSKDGDGTDNVFFDIYGAGTPTDATGEHRIRMGYSKVNDDYTITSKSKDIRFKTDLDKQLVLYQGGISKFEAGDVEITSGDLILSQDLDFVGDTMGLIFGQMYADNITQTVTISTADTYVEVGGGLTGGQTNHITFQNFKELLITSSGNYKIDWSMSVSTSTANDEVEGTVMINSAGSATSTSHTLLPKANVSVTLSGTTILFLSANDVVKLAVLNHTTARDIVVEHANLSIIKIGG